MSLEAIKKLNEIETEKAINSKYIKIAKSILDYAMDNGGGTFNRQGAPITKRGYYVSIKGNETKIQVNEKALIVSKLVDYLKTMEKHNKYYLGLWLDNRLIYLDFSVRFKVKERAIKDGKKNKQIAVWDMFNFTEIRL